MSESKRSVASAVYLYAACPAWLVVVTMVGWLASDKVSAYLLERGQLADQLNAIVQQVGFDPAARIDDSNSVVGLSRSSARTGTPTSAGMTSTRRSSTG